jgi:alkylated DNA nucleotide flippase Atl1
VVRASGYIGKFGSGPDMKKKLLRFEGVEVSDEGMIDRRFFW